MRHVLISFLTVTSLIGCSKHVEDPNVIRMGFTPAENTETVSQNGQVIADLLEKETGYKFKSWVASDYTALVEAMKSGQIQVGWLAPFAFVLAEKHADARVLLKSVRHGQASQYSAIVVRQDSPYKTLADLKGKSMAWTDPSSSSGHIVPKAAVIAKGLDPDVFFGKQTFAGSHESLVMAVMNSSVDAGATFSDDATGATGAWTKFEKNAPAGSKKLRAIYVTPPMPSDTVTVSGKLMDADPAKVAKIKAALLKIAQNPDGKIALKNLYGIEGLVEATSPEYEPLRMAAAKLGVDITGSR